MCELFKGRCLLTGATGYIGSMISRRLLSQGNEITVIVRDAARLEPEIYDCVQVIQADMSDGEAILQISGKYDYVIHCAAPTKSAYMVSGRGYGKYCKWNEIYFRACKALWG